MVRAQVSKPLLDAALMSVALVYGNMQQTKRAGAAATPLVLGFTVIALTGLVLRYVTPLVIVNRAACTRIHIMFDVSSGACPRRLASLWLSWYGDHA